jgi:PilZ domain
MNSMPESADVKKVNAHVSPSPDVAPIELAAPVAAERRRSGRSKANLPGWVSADARDRQSRGGSVTVVDMSLHGIGFYDATRKYDIGALHWVVVSSDALRLSTRVRVVSCRPNPQGGYDVGAAFF